MVLRDPRSSDPFLSLEAINRILRRGLFGKESGCYKQENLKRSKDPELATRETGFRKGAQEGVKIMEMPVVLFLRLDAVGDDEFDASWQLPYSSAKYLK